MLLLLCSSGFLVTLLLSLLLHLHSTLYTSILCSTKNVLLSVKGVPLKALVAEWFAVLAGLVWWVV